VGLKRLDIERLGFQDSHVGARALIAPSFMKIEKENGPVGFRPPQSGDSAGDMKEG